MRSGHPSALFGQLHPAADQGDHPTIRGRTWRRSIRDQRGVAIAHHFLARTRPQQADRTGHIRQVIGHYALAQQGFCYASTCQFGDLIDLCSGSARSLSDEDCDLLALVEEISAAPASSSALGRTTG